MARAAVSRPTTTAPRTTTIGTSPLRQSPSSRPRSDDDPHSNRDAGHRHQAQRAPAESAAAHGRPQDPRVPHRASRPETRHGEVSTPPGMLAGTSQNSFQGHHHQSRRERMPDPREQGMKSRRKRSRRNGITSCGEKPRFTTSRIRWANVSWCSLTRSALVYAAQKTRALECSSMGQAGG